jgi:DNA-binding CsgD family transcriptional regulator
VAQRLNVSPNTVKTHLRKVFAKTGTSRQTELDA